MKYTIIYAVCGEREVEANFVEATLSCIVFYDLSSLEPKLIVNVDRVVEVIAKTK